jgi:sigma-B regulation protein RsbU (phosphoserine phosphatase)
MILATFLVVIPFSYYSIESFSKALINHQTNFQVVMAKVISSELYEDYFDYLLNQIVEARRQREELLALGLRFRTLLNDLEPLSPKERLDIASDQLALMNEHGIETTVFNASGKPVKGYDHFSHIIDWNSVTDIAGRKFNELIGLDSLPTSGLMTILSFSADDRGDQMYLAFCLPIDNASLIKNELVTLTFLMRIDLMRTKAVFTTKSIAEQMTDRLKRLPIEGASVTLIEAKTGRKLVEYGPKTNLPPTAFLERTKNFGTVEDELILNSGEGAHLVMADYLRPLDWFLVMATPVKQILSPVNDLIGQFVIIAVISSIVMCLIAALVTYYFTKPILRLCKEAAAAASLDFNSKEAEEFFYLERHSTRGDEIGSLERAFMGMGRTIVSHVKELLSEAERRERLHGELAAAQGIQLGILPDPDLAVGKAPCQVAARLLTAKEVGGDLYDFFTTQDGREALILGDVSDKGVPAALFMAMTVTLVRQAILDEGLSPSVAMAKVNERLSAQNTNCMFVTLFISLLDPATGSITYANGGHCQPLALSSSGAVRTLEGLSGPMVGALDGFSYLNFNDTLEPGEICLLYTDGVTEAQNEKAEFFGFERLENLARGQIGLSPEDLVELVVGAVSEFRGQAEPSDDICLLAFATK